MKKVISISLIFFATLCSYHSSYAQDKCKVLIERISDSYDGDCKKGFAHGKGIAKGVDSYNGSFKKGYPHGKGKYQWDHGVVYEGQWNKGMKAGAGLMTVPTTKGDSIVKGFWRDNRYLGETNIPSYSVRNKFNLERYTIKKVNHTGADRVKISIKNVGGTNSAVTGLSISTTSGNRQDTGGFMVIENVRFPFDGSIRYTVPRKLGTGVLEVTFDFKINDPSSWELVLYN